MAELHDPYEDQLSAARYKAERDQARQEVERLREELDARPVETMSAYDLLPEKERQIVKMWPRWEDTDEPVMLGECTSILFGQEALSIENRGCFKTYGYGERVKRPEPPDTWERWKKDATMGATIWFAPFDYVEKVLGRDVSGMTITEARQLSGDDLERRAKALSERGAE